MSVVDRRVLLLLDVGGTRLLDGQGVELGDRQVALVADLGAGVDLAVVPAGILVSHVFDLSMTSHLMRSRNEQQRFFSGLKLNFIKNCKCTEKISLHSVIQNSKFGSPIEHQ